MLQCNVTGKKVLRRPRSALARTSSTCDHSSARLPATTGRPRRPKTSHHAHEQAERSQIAAAEQLAKLSQSTAASYIDAAQPSNAASCVIPTAVDPTAAPRDSPCGHSMQIEQASMPDRPGYAQIRAAFDGAQTTMLHHSLLPGQDSGSAPPQATSSDPVQSLSAAPNDTAHAAVSMGSMRTGNASVPVSGSVAVTGMTAGSLAGLPISLAPSSLIRPVASLGIRQSMWQHLHSLPPGSAPPLQSPFAAIATLPFSLQVPSQVMPHHGLPQAQMTSRPQPHFFPQAQAGLSQRQTQLRYNLNSPAPAVSTCQLQQAPDALQSRSHSLFAHSHSQHSGASQAHPKGALQPALPNNTSQALPMACTGPQTANAATAPLSAAQIPASTAARVGEMPSSRPQSGRISAEDANAAAPALSAFATSYARPQSAGLFHPHGTCKPAHALEGTSFTNTSPESYADTQARHVNPRANCETTSTHGTPSVLSMPASMQAENNHISRSASASRKGSAQRTLGRQAATEHSHNVGTSGNRGAQVSSGAVVAGRMPLSPSAVRCNGGANALQPAGGSSATGVSAEQYA